MSRIRYVNENDKVELSPGSTGHRKTVEPQPFDAGAVAWRKTVEARDATIIELRAALAAAQAEIAQRDTLLVGARAEIYKLEETMRYLNAEIDGLREADDDIVTDGSTLGVPLMSTDMSTTLVDKQVVLSGPEVDKADMSTKRQRYPKGQEPWTLEGISRQAWYKRNKKG